MRARQVRRFVVAALVLLATPFGAAADGTIAGRVLLPPPAPPERMPERYRTLSPGVELEAADAPVAIVYLEPAAAGAGASAAATGAAGSAAAAGGAPPRPVTSPAKSSVAQKGLQFRPGLIAVRTGDTIEFPNLDDTYHSVFSYSKVKRFDLGRYRKGEEPASLVFDKPGVVKLFCEIHEHMRATVLVLDTPYFTRTAGDGSFRIENVPPGRYRLTTWVDDARVRSSEVEIADAPSVAIEIDAR